MSDKAPNKTELLGIMDSHLQKVVQYDPYRKFPGVQDRESFAGMISDDPAFSAFGLDDERYIIARIGGNLVTSLHRKLGDLYEAVFHYLLRCRFDLGEDELNYSVDVPIGDRIQKRSTDGVVPVSLLADTELPLLNSKWRTTKGLAFEVRSCYQIGDSKRIQADWDMALSLEAVGLTPVMLVFCNTSLQSPIARLKESWSLFEGNSTFDFVADLTGFNLRGFLKENENHLAELIKDSLANL